jgi:diguanylate cyclase (GGDEF)-like protein
LGVRDRLATVFAKRDDPYAGADLASASRFGGALWFLGSIFTAALLPFVPPDEAIGDAGWLIAGAIIAAGLVIGARMRGMGAAPNVDELLLWSYAAIVAIGVLVWISGGVGSPYTQLFLLSVGYTTAVHPARRSLAYLGCFTVLVLLPLGYDDDAGHDARVTLVAELVIWLTLAFVIIFLMANVRAQRLGLQREGETARRQARLDPLTGLLNRRAFDEDLGRAIERSRATGDPLGVLVGDIDDFKDFNDRFGHLEGDRVLKQVADALQAAVRRPDVAYRWGGDEFAVILPQADLRGAELVAQRIEAAVAGLSGPDGQNLGMKSGAAELDRDDGRAAALVEAADQALMLAKGSGAFDTPQPRG